MEFRETGTELLFGRIAAEAKAPCDAFACARRPDCSAQKLACSAFRYYVHTGSSQNPFIDFPQRITKTQRPVLMDAPNPTREIFEALEQDEDQPYKKADKGEPAGPMISSIFDYATV